MKINLKKFESFYLIFIGFGVFFSFILLLSIPSLFNYEKIKSKIINQIESDYSINASEISEINYRFFPSPHLVLNNFKLKLNETDEQPISNVTEAKLFISVFKLYNAKQIFTKKLLIQNQNFTFTKNSINSLLNHLYKTKNKNIVIKKSNFFFKDNQNEITTISPVQNIEYKINNKSNNKKIRLNGNIFDTDYKLIWEKNFNKPKISSMNLKFNNPNLYFQNELIIDPDTKFKKGNLKIKFLSNNFKFIYDYNGHKLNFKTENEFNDKFHSDGYLIFKPFYFDINAKANNHKIQYLIKSILYNLFNYKNDIHPNLSGDLKINFEKIQNAYLKSGYIKLNFDDRKITIKDNHLDIRNIGKLISNDNLFYEENGELYFVSEIIIQIDNQSEFYRRFSIPKSKRVNLENIYVILQNNLDKDYYSISNFKINNTKGINFNLNEIHSLEKIDFNNLQQFRNIILDEFNKN